MCAVNHEWLTNASAGHHIYQTIQSKLFPRAARRMERGVGGGVRPGPRQHILQTNEPCKFRFASSDSAVAPGPRFGPVVLKLQAHRLLYPNRGLVSAVTHDKIQLFHILIQLSTVMHEEML